MYIRPWPSVREEDQWLIKAMEDGLSKSTRTPDELRGRASELRVEAEESEIPAVREATLALAEHYEDAAAVRLAAR